MGTSGNLPTILQALGRSVGLTVVTDSVPDKTINYDITGKPFRDIWSLLVRLNDLDFELLPNDIVIVGPPSVVQKVRGGTAANTVNTERRFYTVINPVENMVGFLRSELPGVTITPVSGTQVISVTATPAQHDEIISLLSRVDVANTQTAIVQRVFQLANAKAAEVKKVLEGTLQLELTTPQQNTDPAVTPTPAANTATPAASTAQAQGGGATGSASTPVPNLQIIADVRTNTLVVRGTPTQVNQIAELIPQLDQRVPQINVQVRIQEVSETAVRTLGVDWSAGIGNFVTKILGGQLTAIFDATQSTTGFNIGATLNALETQGFAKRVDDSTITLQSGQTLPAVLKSGGTLSINLVGAGDQKIEKEIDYGVTVNLLNPQVSSDGTISLRVETSVKDFLGDQTDPSFINLTNREAQTNLSFKSGQTVLLGGLLTTRDTVNSKGVPFLSSIPLIGNLFKNETINKEQTQLMLVITANVLE